MKSKSLAGLFSPIILALAILCGFNVASRAENISLQIRMQKALENARAITNIEIQYDDFLWMKGRPISATASNEWKKNNKKDYPFDKDYTRTLHDRYIASGRKYRTESTTECLQKPENNRYAEMAFDGKLWSSSSGKSMSQLDGDNPADLQNQFNPITLPFLFLSRTSIDCPLCTLRFTDFKSPDALNGLVLPEPQSSNGLLYVSFPGLPLHEGNQTWEIALDAADVGFKPISITRTVDSGGKYLGYRQIFTLSNYTNVGSYEFPTKAASSTFYLGTNHLNATTSPMTTMVSVISFKTPAEIPDATFKLDESKVDHIWNMGQFKGFGVGLHLGEEGTNIIVKRIDEDSPAGRQNTLHHDDRIVAIAGSPVHAGKADLSRAYASLQGAKDSTVNITFIPAGMDDSQTQKIALVRGEARGRLGGGRELTNGMKAPDIELVSLKKEQLTEHLSDFAGKIVVLEMWASWCPPCRTNMAQLQLELSRHPEWKDKVAVIAASVDDNADVAAKKIDSMGWNQTHNVWLATKDIKSYHVGAIPAAYFIDARGMIVACKTADEHGLNISELINQQLKSK